MTITVTGATLTDVRIQLGIGFPDVSVRLHDNGGQITYKLTYRGDTFVCSSPESASRQIRILLHRGRKELMKQVRSNTKALNGLLKKEKREKARRRR